MRWWVMVHRGSRGGECMTARISTKFTYVASVESLHRIMMSGVFTSVRHVRIARILRWYRYRMRASYCFKNSRRWMWRRGLWPRLFSLRCSVSQARLRTFARTLVDVDAANKHQIVNTNYYLYVKYWSNFLQKSTGLEWNCGVEHARRSNKTTTRQDN